MIAAEINKRKRPSKLARRAYIVLARQSSSDVPSAFGTSSLALLRCEHVQVNLPFINDHVDLVALNFGLKRSAFVVQ